MDELTTPKIREGGGITHKPGQVSAYCILDLRRVSANRFLLAHELGHVLGLDDPDKDPSRAGSPGSIMQPATPNPNRNTLFNCRIFIGGPGVPPLNPLVATTAIADCFRPDPG